MAKKTSAYHFSYDAPVILSFVIASATILAVDSLFLHGKLIDAAFTCRTLHPSEGLGFDFKNGLDYLRMISHILGNPGWENLLLNSAFLLLLGPTLEERYGSAMLLVMMVMTALVSGVLLVCFGSGNATGSSCIVFMLILLSALTAIAKKDIEISWILTFILYTAYRMVSSTKDFKLPAADSTNASSLSAFLLFLKLNLHTFIDLFSGIIGSLFGLLVSPKKRSAPTKKKTVKAKEETAYTDYDYSSQDKTYAEERGPGDEVVGTLEL